jgi:hypothetical protein
LRCLPRALAPADSRVLGSIDARVRVDTQVCVFGRLIDGQRWNHSIWLGVPEPDQLADGLAKGADQLRSAEQVTSLFGDQLSWCNRALFEAPLGVMRTIALGCRSFYGVRALRRQLSGAA